MDDISAHSLDQMKVPEIRSLLADRGLDTTGSKAALIDRLTVYTKQSCDFATHENSRGTNGNTVHPKNDKAQDDGKLFSSL